MKVFGDTYMLDDGQFYLSTFNSKYSDFGRFLKKNLNEKKIVKITRIIYSRFSVCNHKYKRLIKRIDTSLSSL